MIELQKALILLLILFIIGFIIATIAQTKTKKKYNAIVHYYVSLIRNLTDNFNKQIEALKAENENLKNKNNNNGDKLND